MVKMRSDFVTNSSSASYLLVFKTPGFDKKDVIERLTQHYSRCQKLGYPGWLANTEEAKRGWEEEKVKSLNRFPSRMDLMLQEKSNGIFELHEGSSMHNSWTDGLPLYLQEFIFDILASKGWEVISLHCVDEG